MVWRNVPQYNVDNYSFGQGVMYAGAAGATPTVDIGAIRGDAKLSITRTLLEVLQGAPQRLTAQFATKEEVTLTVTGIEWNVQNLQYALGAGELTLAAGEDDLEFGGDLNVDNIAIKTVHSMPTGHTIEVYLWKAQGGGEITVTFGDELHEFPYTFKALHAGSDWAGGTLADNKSLFKIRRIKA
jgi:hypothetical protein